MQRQSAIVGIARVRARSLAAAIAAGLLAGACSSGSGLTPLDGLLGGETAKISDGSEKIAQSAPKTELEKAIEHWGDQYKKKPHDLKAALAYARNLKAAGYKDQAFTVVQNAALLHGDSKELAAEYGRLALEFDQVALADTLLTMAEDPMKPDWRVTSARGTVMAKQGRYADAIPFYERALAISPSQPSVLNNLAMAHAANGDSSKAEQILRTVASKGSDPKIQQNLSLVVGLQGKHDEAKLIAASHMPAEVASSDSDYIKRMVKATPAAAPVQAAPAVMAKPQRGIAAPKLIEAKTVEPKAVVRPAVGDTFRPSGEPGAVQGTSGAWSTTVSR